MAYSKNIDVRIKDLLIENNLNATPNQMKAVKLLMKKPMTKTQLAKALKIKKNSIYYLISRFEEEGVSDKRPNLRDMRGHLHFLSEKFLKKLTHKPIMYSF